MKSPPIEYIQAVSPPGHGRDANSDIITVRNGPRQCCHPPSSGRPSNSLYSFVECCRLVHWCTSTTMAQYSFLTAVPRWVKGYTLR